MMRASIIVLVAMAFSVMVEQADAVAGAFEVAPTTLHLARGSRSAVFYIVNRGERPVVAQTESLDWSQDDMLDSLTPSSTMVVSPPMAKLMPGQRQTVRVAVAANAQDTVERSFRLVVSELPDPSAPKEQGVNVLLQFSVPVFIDAAEKTPPNVQWMLSQSPQGLLLVAHNLGSRHVKLSKITLAQSNGQQLQVAPNGFNYILAGATHAWSMVTPVANPGEKIMLAAQDEDDGAISSAVFMPR